MVKLVILTFALFLLNLSFGSTSMSMNELIGSSVLWQLRLPTALVCFFSGAILALSGFVTQSLFKNSLATPYTLGVSSFASLGAIVGMTLDFEWAAVSFMSLIFSFICVSALLLAYKIFRYDGLRLLLLGVALSLFSSSLISIMQVTTSKLDLALFLTWIMGSVSTVGYESVLLLLLSFVVLVVSCFFHRRSILLLSVEGDDSYTRGFDPVKLRAMLLFIVSLCVGLLVSRLGPIGFVGLIIPHITSRLVPFRSAQLIFGNVLFGASFVLLSDMLNRYFLSDFGLPVGVLITAIGAPVFAVILVKKSI